MQQYHMVKHPQGVNNEPVIPLIKEPDLHDTRSHSLSGNLKIKDLLSGIQKVIHHLKIGRNTKMLRAGLQLWMEKQTKQLGFDVLPKYWKSSFKPCQEVLNCHAKPYRFGGYCHSIPQQMTKIVYLLRLFFGCITPSLIPIQMWGIGTLTIWQSNEKVRRVAFPKHMKGV